jgi:hypothetical protein
MARIWKSDRSDRKFEKTVYDVKAIASLKKLFMMGKRSQV